MLFDAGSDYRKGHNAENYGLGYMGSKNTIIKELAVHFPKADNFYDLFCGGGSVTHYLMANGKYRRYFMNDLDPLPIDLFKRAIMGEFRNEKRWISREDFFRLRESDSYVFYCWSFGNRGDTYLYGTDIEPYKKAGHYAIVFDDWTELEKVCPEVIDVTKKAVSSIVDLKQRRLRFTKAVADIVERLKTGDSKTPHCLGYLERLQSLERLERLQSLEGLERIQRLENLDTSMKTLTFSVKSYDEVQIAENSVIYCDIPYENTAEYNISKKSFDYERFYGWCAKQKEPLYVSSYELPSDKFYLVAEFNRHVTFSSKNVGSAIERLYVPMHQKGNIIESKLF